MHNVTPLVITWSATIGQRFSVVINTINRKNLATIWKVISSSHRVFISGWLLWFSDFQRNLRFGSKLAERDVDLGKKADFLSVLSLMFCRL